MPKSLGYRLRQYRLPDGYFFFLAKIRCSFLDNIASSFSLFSLLSSSFDGSSELPSAALRALDFTNNGTVPLKDTTAPSTPAGLASTEGNNTLDNPPGPSSQQKGTTPWIPHQVFLHNRRKQHPGYPTRSSFTTEGNNTVDTPPGLPSQQKGATQDIVIKEMMPLDQAYRTLLDLKQGLRRSDLQSRTLLRQKGSLTDLNLAQRARAKANGNYCLALRKACRRLKKSLREQIVTMTKGIVTKANRYDD
ncbi:hypothetical protein Taro_000932 [Colocasia esculenta]|uniref:Uncharacterized protein n=1 Tax=Colocasia esculenta TaxID=4460 RepID=A0A843T8J6_COLES|nr:hypothetical protein [Colocasia esculenta]